MIPYALAVILGLLAAAWRVRSRRSYSRFAIDRRSAMRGAMPQAACEDQLHCDACQYERDRAQLAAGMVSHGGAPRRWARRGGSELLVPSAMGAGRFARIGIPAPDALGPFIGVVEIVGGAMLVLGMLTRMATLPLLVDIRVAILSTKVRMLLGHGYGPFTLPQLNRYGFWSAASEGRTDFAMLMGLLFLLIIGGAPWSLDAVRSRGAPASLPTVR